MNKFWNGVMATVVAGILLWLITQFVLVPVFQPEAERPLTAPNAVASQHVFESKDSFPDITNSLDETESKATPDNDIKKDISYKLSELNYFVSEGMLLTNKSDKDNLGETRRDNISGSFTNLYKINGEYQRIEGTLFQRYEYRSNTNSVGNLEQYIKIFGDEELLYEAYMNGGIEPIDFSVKIEGVQELVIEFESTYRFFVGTPPYYYFYSALSEVNLFK